MSKWHSLSSEDMIPEQRKIRPCLFGLRSYVIPLVFGSVFYFFGVYLL
jgi:hypothetical protein